MKKHFDEIIEFAEINKFIDKNILTFQKRSLKEPQMR